MILNKKFRKASIILLVGPNGFMNGRMLFSFNSTIIRLLGNKVSVKYLTTELIPTNKKAVHVVDKIKITDNIKTCGRWFNYIFACESETALKIYKKHSIGYAQVLCYMETIPKKSRTFIYAEDEFGILKQQKNYIVNNGGTIFFILFYPFLCLACIAIILRTAKRYYSFGLRAASACKYTGLHEIYHYGDDLREGFSENLINGLQDTALLMSPHWVVSPVHLQRFMTRCRKNRIEVVDPKKFTYNLTLIFKIIFRVTKSFLLLTKIRRNIPTARLICLVVQNFVLETINLSNYLPKYILSYEDMSIGHMVRRTMLRESRIDYYGVAHSSGSGLYGNPSLAFIEFDKYFIWNKFSLNLFKNYWNSSNCTIVGYPRHTQNMHLGFEQQKKVREHVIKEYNFKENKKNILITLPSLYHGEDEPLFIKFKQFMQAISSFDRKGSANIIIRPKIPTRPEKKGMLDLAGKYVPKNNTINYVKDEKFSTQDLIHWSDFVIASNGSGIITEACVLQKPVVTFCYLDCLREIWGRHGIDMCLSNGEDTRKILNKVIDEVEIAVDYQKLCNNLLHNGRGLKAELSLIDKTSVKGEQ